MKKCHSRNVKTIRFYIYIDTLVSVIYLFPYQTISLSEHCSANSITQSLFRCDKLILYDYRCLFKFLDNNRFLSDSSKHQSRADHSNHFNIIHNAISNV